MGHATIWTGTAPSMIDLNPSGAAGSFALATSGINQAGYAVFGSSVYTTAGMWSGSAASWINLQPQGAVFSFAYAISGNHQAGQVGLPDPNGPGELPYAALWSGSASSWVNLSPGLNFGSAVLGMSGEQEVGWVSSATMAQHASMWNSTAASWRDLHPHLDGASIMSATCGSAQVGWVSSSVTHLQHAGIWFGTAASYIDLAQFLPQGYAESSASAIDVQNGVYTVGGWAINASTNRSEAFIWVGVPSPATSVPMLLSGLVLTRRRRHDVSAP